MTEAFSVGGEQVGAQGIVRVAGEVDAYTAPQLRDAAHRLVDDGVESLVIDLTDVTFIDSTGLGVIVGLRKRTRLTGESVCAVISPDQRMVRAVFEITGLDKVIPVLPTVDEAMSRCATVEATA